MKKTNKIEFLTPYEVEAMADLTPRQLKIMDILRSWYITRGKETNQFTISASQISSILGCSTRTTQRELVVLEAQGYIQREQVKVNGVAWRTTNYFIPMFVASDKNVILSSQVIDNQEVYGDKGCDKLGDKNNGNDVDLSYSISNSISNSISKSLSSNVTNSNSKMENTITYTNGKYTVVHHYTNLDEVKEFYEFCERTFGNSSTFTEVERREARAHITTTPTTQRNTDMKDKVGQAFFRLNQLTKEVKALEDTHINFYALTKDGEFQKALMNARAWVKENESTLTPRQMEALMDKCNRLEDAINTKRVHISDFIAGKFNKPKAETTAKVESTQQPKAQAQEVTYDGKTVTEDEVVTTYRQLIPEVQRQLSNYQRTKDKADSPKELVEVMQCDILPMVKKFNTSLYNEWQNELTTLLQATNSVTESVIVENTVVESALPTTVEADETQQPIDIVVEEATHPKSDIEELVEALTAEDEDDYGVSCIRYSTVVA